MRSIKAFFALFKGLHFCFSHKRIRRLAIWPWLLGAVIYIAAMVGAYYSHAPVLEMIADSPEGFLSYLWYGLAWLLVGGLLLIAALLLTVVIVMVFTGVFQTAIALETLKAIGADVPLEEAGVKAVLKETSRTILTESVKLVWLLPLILLSIVIGFIPLLTPFALILGGWLLAYQFIDVVLDVYRIRASRRIRFAARHGLLLVCFGLGLVFVSIVPFVGLFIPPIATAGAAWLLSETGLLAEALSANPDAVKNLSSPADTESRETGTPSK